MHGLHGEREPADEGAASREESVPLADLLQRYLPREIPDRSMVIDRQVRFVERLLEANARFNLTSITGREEIAIKHIVDSLLPWRLLREGTSLLDLGSGAGFPGIPLACVFPDREVLLVESVRKKAAFLSDVVRELALENCEVIAERGETLLRSRRADTLVARAVGSIEKLLTMLRPVASRRVRRLFLYKGPHAEAEVRDARAAAEHARVRGRVIWRYELPRGMGSRKIVEYRALPPSRSRGRSARGKDPGRGRP